MAVVRIRMMLVLAVLALGLAVVPAASASSVYSIDLDFYTNYQDNQVQVTQEADGSHGKAIKRNIKRLG